MKTAIDQCDLGDFDAFSGFDIAPGTAAFVETTGYLPLSGNSPRACPGSMSTTELPVTTSLAELPGLSVGPLDPGSYYLTRVKSLRLTTVPRQAFEACDTAPAYALLPGAYYSGIKIAPDTKDRYFRLDIPSPQQITAVSGWPILVCADCDAARSPFDSCTQLQLDPTSTAQTIQGEMLLMIPGQTPTAKMLSVVTLQQADRCVQICPYDRTSCPVYCGNGW